MPGRARGIKTIQNIAAEEDKINILPAYLVQETRQHFVRPTEFLIPPVDRLMIALRRIGRAIGQHSGVGVV